jgi:hypothetical protein
MTPSDRKFLNRLGALGLVLLVSGGVPVAMFFADMVRPEIVALNPDFLIISVCLLLSGAVISAGVLWIVSTFTTIERGGR